jgi:hypothetical protein
MNKRVFLSIRKSFVCTRSRGGGCIVKDIFCSDRSSGIVKAEQPIGLEGNPCMDSDEDGYQTSLATKHAKQ